MGAAVCHIMLGEANTRYDLIGNHNKCQDFNIYLNVWLEVFIKLMLCLVFILTHIVGSNMEIVSFFPAIGFLFAL
jgi:hypothetical protein